MIYLRSIKFFGVSDFFSAPMERLRINHSEFPMFDTIETCVCLFDAFMKVTGRDLMALEPLNLDVLLLKTFKGFLLVETDASNNYIEVMFRLSKPLFESIGFDDFEFVAVVGDVVKNECVSIYLAETRSQEVINYYQGWQVFSSDGHLMHIDLVLCHKLYGDQYSRDVYRKIQRYIRRYIKATALFKLANIKFVFSYMLHFLPSLEATSLLAEGQEVNYFFEHVKRVEELRVRELKMDMPSFKKRWAQVMLVVHEFFVTYKIMSTPAYKLPKVTFTPGPKLAVSSTVDLVQMITPIPSHIGCDKDAAKICRDITEDVENIVTICERVRAKILTLVQKRICEAENYQKQLGEGFEDYPAERYARACYNWEKYNYSRLSRRDKYALYSGQPGIAEKMGLLNGTTLLPFLFLLVYQHPQITPSWLLKFELFGSDGQQYGLKEDGSFAVSEKSRRGFVNAQQVIGLNTKSKAIFADIQSLTQQARDYLRSIGNDDWRFLLLGKHRGFSVQRRITKLDRIDEGMHVTCPLTIELVKLFKCDERDIVKRIGLRPFRINVAIMRLFQTGDEFAMSEDLGHVGSGDDDLKSYVPLALKQYFSNSRTRLFHNAFIFEAMKDSPYLIEALDFADLDELDNFLTAHRLKPLPDSMSLKAFMMEENFGSDDLDSSRAVVTVSEALCTVLLTLADVVKECRSSGLTIKDVASTWYHTAELVKVMVSLHDKGQISTCSPKVIKIFKGSSYSDKLANRLRDLVAEKATYSD
ncbi:hypothetical protein [Pseudomonas mandelii]|uniref:hypothetical protein n=1 Tax=Pseudomonas mandelii TaxID=75612 RepID=UPI00039FCC09|nr:hypothetical protein [Pseudomonas mandelii]